MQQRDVVWHGQVPACLVPPGVVQGYLMAVRAVGSANAGKALAQLRQTTINDVYAKNGRIRDNGLMTHDLYLLRVKSPGTSAGPWDYYDLVQTFVGEAAWTPKEATTCTP